MADPIPPRPAERTDRARRTERARPGRDRADRGRRPATATGASRGTWKETIRFWTVSLLVILFLRAFIFEPYRIPSESMEGTLLVWDFLIVSKLHYGPRTPNTLGVPFTPIYVPGIQFPQTRLPGFSRVRRGDVAVFNYPAATDVVRGTIPSSVPIERRDPYIKRIVGVPGDTLTVVDKVLYVNGEAHPLAPTMKQRWRVYATGEAPPSAEALADAGVTFLGVVTEGGRPVQPVQYDVVATTADAGRLASRTGITRVEPYVLPPDVTISQLTFPLGSDNNPDQFGPIVVPREGQAMPLNVQTWPMLREVITRYEGHEARLLGDGRVEVDGAPAATFTPRQDYYFAMGDNRDNSVDGRYWGFVPEDHLVGRAVFTFLSFDPATWLPRLGRFFRPIP